MTNYVLNSYFKGFCGTLVLVVFAYYLADAINQLHLLTVSSIEMIQIIGISIAAIALYGQRTWDIQTWSGETFAEKTNNWLFNILSSIGFFLSIMGMLLKSF